jgi:CubicO group peptidase (beta-lactamase class C family)
MNALCVALFTLLLATIPDAPGQQRPTAPESLIGLWGSEQFLGPQVRGELIIDGRGARWLARIAGFEVPIERSDFAVRFVLPNGAGEFRGQLSSDSKTLTGHWIQPASNIFFQRYATPIELRNAAPSVWTGVVRPLDERISFYLQIARLPDGRLEARIRNPEFGWLSRSPWPVEMKDANVTFGSGQNQAAGSYDSANDLLTLGLLNPPATPVVFTRRSPENAIGLYPRTPPSPAETYTYHEPIAENDGWATSSLSQAGLDPAPITQLMQSILAANPNDQDFVPIHSILIARNGKLAVEEYFYGFDRNRPHDMRSAGKTIAPMLVGVVRDHGPKLDADTAVYSLFSNYKPFANWDERKSKLTLQDLMTMTSGLACEDSDSSSPGNENQMQSQTQERDWYRYTLNLPMKRDPGGSSAIYCSATLNLVGGAAERATKRWNADLFYQYLAKPLQFGEYHLNLMPTGDVYTGGGAYLRPRDELKLGQLYLGGGVWNGRRVIDKDWVAKSTTAHATFIRPVVDIDQNHEYGYGWHIHHFKVAGRVYREYAAEGNGGQLVIVIPDLKIVAAINAGGYGSAVWYRWGLEMIPRYLIPAVSWSRNTPGSGRTTSVRGLRSARWGLSTLRHHDSCFRTVDLLSCQGR